MLSLLFRFLMFAVRLRMARLYKKDRVRWAVWYGHLWGFLLGKMLPHQNDWHENVRQRAMEKIDVLDECCEILRDNEQWSDYVSLRVLKAGLIGSSKNLYSDTEKYIRCASELETLVSLFDKFSDIISSTPESVGSFEIAKAALRYEVFEFESRLPRDMATKEIAQDIKNDAYNLLIWAQKLKKSPETFLYSSFMKLCAYTGVILSDAVAIRHADEKEKEKIKAEAIQFIQRMEKLRMPKILTLLRSADGQQFLANVIISKMQIGIYTKDYKIMRSCFADIYKGLKQTNKQIYFGKYNGIKNVEYYWLILAASNIRRSTAPYDHSHQEKENLIINLAIKLLKQNGISSSERDISLLRELCFYLLYTSKWSDAEDVSNLLISKFWKVIRDADPQFALHIRVSALRGITDMAAFAHYQLTKAEPHEEHVSVIQRASEAPFWRMIRTIELGRSIAWKVARLRSQGVNVENRKLEHEDIKVNRVFFSKKNEIVLVTLSITEIGGIALIYGRSLENPISVNIPAYQTKKLYRKVYNKDGWVDQYENFLSNFKDRNVKKRNQAMYKMNEEIESILELLWFSCVETLHEALENLSLTRDSNVHICVSAPLINLPIASAGYRDRQGKWSCFNDHWIVTVSDSLAHEMFDFAHMRQKVREKNDLKIVEVLNPESDLSLSYFSQTSDRKRLENGAASKGEVMALLRQCDRATIACHATWNRDEPEKSGLQLAGGTSLTVADLQSYYFLRRPVIVLAACEAIPADIRFQASENRSFAVGLLWAGASAVVAAYWPISTKYGELLCEHLDASGSADSWNTARKLTYFQRLLRDECPSAVSGDGKGDPERSAQYKNEDDVTYAEWLTDFSRPIHWASFGCLAR